MSCLMWSGRESVGVCLGGGSTMPAVVEETVGLGSWGMLWTCPNLRVSGLHFYPSLKFSWALQLSLILWISWVQHLELWSVRCLGPVYLGDGCC